jgi:hypothetical protein
MRRNEENLPEKFYAVPVRVFNGEGYTLGPRSETLPHAEKVPREAWAYASD